MSERLIKILFHPLFRLVFWLALSVWLVFLGLDNTGLAAWINYFMAIISLAQVITNGEEAIASFQKKE